MWVNIAYKRLPDIYQEVEYIESSWTQKINTWYTTNSNMRVECEFYTTNTANDNVIFATENWSWAWSNYILCFTNNTDFLVGTNSETKFTGIPLSTKHKVDFSLSSITLDNTTITKSSSVGTYNISLFQWNTKAGKVRIYSFKAYTWTTLERDLVPCYRKSDDEIWMYDTVNNVFYTNSWSWTFVKWNNACWYYELKKAYVWTAWFTPTEHTKIYLPLESNYSDLSEYKRAYTNFVWWLSFSSYWWVAAAYFNYWYLTFPLTDLSTDEFTISAWVSVERTSTWEILAYLTSWNTSQNFNYWISNSSQWWSAADFYWSSTAYDWYSWVPYSTWWHLLTITKKWTTVKYYLDKTLIWTKTANSNSWNITRLDLWCRYDVYSSQWWKWWAREFILEDKEWSLADLTDYYNLSKNIFWISS